MRRSEDEVFDLAVVGGGHNGLALAALAADAGRRVVVIEANSRVGGAVETKRFDCGCYVNRGANAYGMLAPTVEALLERHDSTSQVVRADPSYAVVGPQGLIVGPSDDGSWANHLRSQVPLSAPGIFALFEDLDRVAQLTNSVWDDSPDDAHLLWERLQVHASEGGPDYRSASIKDLCEWFSIRDEDAGVAFAGASLFPAASSEPGTALPLLYLALSTVNGSSGWGSVVGGYDRLTSALHGIVIRQQGTVLAGSAVEGIDEIHSPTKALRMQNGTTVYAKSIGCAVDPWRFSKIAGLDLRPDAHDSIHDGGCAKVNLLLIGAPRANSLVRLSTTRSVPMVVRFPSLSFFDAAFEDYRQTGCSAKPYLELTFTSHLDAGASCGAHLPLSAFVLFVSRDVPADRRAEVRSRILAEVLGFVASTTGLGRDASVWEEVLLPSDIENEWGMTRGNVDHGAMREPNLLKERGLLLDALEPVNGVFLASAGSHPGGLVSARPAVRAAREVECYLDSLDGDYGEDSC